MQTKPLIIYQNETGRELCRVEKWTFNDKAKGIDGQYLTMEIKSPYEVNFSIGDYCEYRGVRYYLNLLPTTTQKARRGEYAEAFVYQNVRFDGAGFELCRILMLDIVPTTPLWNIDKGTNYTGSSNFQLFCGETRANVNGKEVVYPAVCTLAGKIQANLDRAYPNLGWKVHVNISDTTTINGEAILVTHTDDKVLSFNGTTVANALSEVSNTFKLDYFIKGRNIYIGYTLGAVTGAFPDQGAAIGDNNYFHLGYGSGYADAEHPGRGLYEITKRSDNNQQIVTRLRAMGSTKNMPYHYYKKRYDLSQTLFPSNLQLPDTFRSPSDKHKNHAARKRINPIVNEVLGASNDSYLDVYDDIKKCTEGLREGVALWDGSMQDLPEIYPTIENMTYGELRGALCPDMLGNTEQSDVSQDADGHRSYHFYKDKERIDEILCVGKLSLGRVAVDDANIGQGVLPESIQDRYATTDCPCSFSERIRFPYTAQYNCGPHQLFPTIKLQPKGKYILSPNGIGLVAGISIRNGRYLLSQKPIKADFSYTIKLYAKPCNREAVGNVIGVYKSKTIRIDNSDIGFVFEVDLPKMPDIQEEVTGKQKDEPQIKQILLNELSDVDATIEFHLSNIHSDSPQREITLSYYVGKSRKAPLPDESFSSVYLWALAPEDAKTINDPFHVVIKDLGLKDFKAQFTSNDEPMLVMKDGACVGRSFKINKDGATRVTYLKDGKTYNGWQLELTRATDTSLHTYYPSEHDRLEAGDHYVLLGISMPDTYVQAAEMRLLVAASQYLQDNSKTKYSYEPKIDEIFVARNYDMFERKGKKEQSIYWNLYAGLRLPFYGHPISGRQDEPLPLINIPIDTLTIKEGEGILPKIELKLKEGEQQSSYQRMAATIDKLYDGLRHGGQGLSQSDTSVIIKHVGDSRFLRKDVSDIAVEVITFVKGIIAKAVSYFSGIVNQGDLTNKGNMANSGNISNEGDLTNKGMISTKNLTVTGKATFFELEIQKAKAAGGMIVNSPSTFHIDAVEETADGWRCFQRAEQDGVVLMPMCEEGDQMMCANGMNVLKNGKGNRYYWRKVVLAMPAPVDFIINGKKEPCLRIDLSKTDRDPSSDDAPQVGDELVQVGSRTNKDRQGVIMTSAYKSFDAEIKAPYWAQYEGVDDYDLSKHRRTFFAHEKSAVYGDLMVKTGDGYVSQADVNTSTEKRFTTIEADAKGIRQAVADKATRTEVSQTADRLRQEVTNSERELRTTITQTADQIGLQISNGTHPNLLWGSDLTLEGVNVNDMQAVEQKIGVHVSCDKGFEYLSGQGVDGSDAMYFKCDPSKDLKFRGLYWEKSAGARKNIKVRRNTTYTISAWVRFSCSPAENSADYYLEAYATASADDTKRIRQYDMKWTAKPHSGREWKRVVCSFTSAEYDYISLAILVHGLGVGEFWVCRPKLELGEKATPWCEYDGTEEGLRRTGIDIKEGKIILDAKNTIVKENLTTKRLLTNPTYAGGPYAEIYGSEFLIRYGDGNKGAQFGIGDDGLLHLIFFDADGKAVGDLGPGGWSKLVDATTESKWTEIRLKNITGEKDINVVRGVMAGSTPSYYRFTAARNSKLGVAGENAEYDNQLFIRIRDFSEKIQDGWYISPNDGKYNEWIVPYEPLVGKKPLRIYVTRCYHYLSGKLQSTVNIYYTEDGGILSQTDRYGELLIGLSEKSIYEK